MPGLFGILAVVAIVLAMTLLVFKTRVLENTFRFLGLIGFIILLTFWIFSLALSGFNGLLNDRRDRREPFPPFGAATIISLAALIIWAAIALIRRMRSRSAWKTNAKSSQVQPGPARSSQVQPGIDLGGQAP